MNRIVVIFLLLAATAGMAQKKSTKPAVAETKPVLWKEDIFSNLKFRSIGPAFMAGFGKHRTVALPGLRYLTIRPPIL